MEFEDFMWKLIEDWTDRYGQYRGYRIEKDKYSDSLGEHEQEVVVYDGARILMKYPDGYLKVEAWDEFLKMFRVMMKDIVLK